MSRIKKIIKYSLNKMLKAKAGEIERSISQAEIISFDIFDTLVKRNVGSPEEVHELVYTKYLKQTGKSICDYKKLRVNAEVEARKNTCKEEILLGDIFGCIKGISQDDKTILQRLEEETEIEVCCPNLLMKAIYEKALKGNKRIIITSDMYLDECVIRRILSKCGYNNYEKLYLSSTFGMCKTTGSIYGIIKEDYCDFRGKILHIGDNVKGDYIIAKTKGIAALLIDGQQNWLRYWKSKNRKVENQFLYRRLYSFLNNHIVSSNSAVCIGYEVLGSMLLGYCKWLNEKIKSDNIEKLFFLSREGKLLQEAFNILYPDSNIPQCYLSVSRQSLLVPLLADATGFDEMIDILKCFFHRPLLKTIRVVCKLDQEKFCYELKKIGLNEVTPIHAIVSRKKQKVYDIVKLLGRDRFEQQKEYVEKYLEENQFRGNLAIIDIGWKGTMQNVLQKYVADSGTVLHGYYLGVINMEADDYYDDMHRNGYLFEPGRDDEYALMERLTGEIFEILFLSRMGSVQEYAMENGYICPVLAEPEYTGYEGEFIESLQGAALDFLRIVREDGMFVDDAALKPDIIMSPYSRFAVYPYMSTIKIFEKFQFVDGDVKKLLPEHGVFYYMFHFKTFKQDLDGCLCKIFFMRKLFKINLPYFKFLQFLIDKLHIKSNYRKKYYSNDGNRSAAV